MVEEMDETGESQEELMMWHKGPQVIEDDDSVTIYRSERIGIPKRVMDRYFDDRDGLRFFVTKDRKKIGLQPCDFEDENAYKIQTTGNKGMVNASSFLEHVGIDFDESIERPAEWDTEREVLLVDVSGEEAELDEN
jgi:hypothetical protein